MTQGVGDLLCVLLTVVIRDDDDDDDSLPRLDHRIVLRDAWIVGYLSVLIDLFALE